MGKECSSIEGGDTDAEIHESSGTITIRNKEGDDEECNWVFEPSQDTHDVMVANVTAMNINCTSESLRIAGKEYCNASAPFCVSISQSLCNSTLSVPGCEEIPTSQQLSVSFNGHVDAEDHGILMKYQFYKCEKIVTQTQELPFATPEDNTNIDDRFSYENSAVGEDTTDSDDHEDYSSSLIGILVPVLLLGFILALITCFYLLLRYKAKRRASRNTEDPVTFQQYVTSVGADNYVMAADVVPGTSLTLEFGQSYETVPRGTAREAVPVYSMTQAGSDFSLNESMEDNQHETIRSQIRDARNVRKSLDTSSISNLSVSNGASTKNTDRPMYSAVRKSLKKSDHGYAFIDDMDNSFEVSDHGDDVTAQSYQLANDLTDSSTQSRDRVEQPKPKNEPVNRISKDVGDSKARQSDGLQYENLGFVEDGSLVKDDS